MQEVAAVVLLNPVPSVLVVRVLGVLVLLDLTLRVEML
jgi:hypothetical protein